ncbi:putative zinc metallopeptidase protein [Rosellinia necatrix]|uniref:Putative zinc metallopeptidase protein n=1 Tax=Rosellinia necatrix TaxID=77044 RepID=A0A1W2TN85_ROSNE|nr:putative zinc metallopeptidase protein [Rosellinia necatrix]
MILENVVSDAREHSAALWDVELRDGYVHDVRPSEASPDTPAQLVLPPLCHPHIHLDKAYILTCNNRGSPQYPDYSDLGPTSGLFQEALANTSRAKARYTPEDLYRRGSQLLATSYAQGVTSTRAFVEIDHATGTMPLTTAIRHKRDFAHLLELQICAFAQDPIFSTADGDANRATMEDALDAFAGHIEVLGTTPYVERSREASLLNIKWAITRALKYRLHLDFHLDYTLEPPLPLPSQAPLIYSVIDLLKEHDWVRIADGAKTIVFGHCTQLSMLGDAERKALALAIIESKLPIHFVGLPTSDIFMMGRPDSNATSSHHRPRGTIHVPSMIKDLGLSACVGVNNVGNAFTPFGTGDPLQLASWLVGIFQVGTATDAELLYECVSNRARQAIGLGSDAQCGPIRKGQKLSDMLLVKNLRTVELPGVLEQTSITVIQRPRLSIKDVVWDPPETNLRSITRWTPQPGVEHLY